VRNVISAIFDLAEDCDWATGNPARRVRLPQLEPVRHPRALSREQLDKVLGELQEPYRSIVSLCASTGLRIGELIALRWIHVNLTNTEVVLGSKNVPAYTIAITDNYTAGERTTLKSKRSKRPIPMTSGVWVLLAARFEAAVITDFDTPVFPNRKGGHLDAHNIANRHFKPAAERAGIPWASLHCLRHTTATTTDSAWMTMSERMGFLGHASVGMTARYTHSDIEQIRAKLEASEMAGAVIQ
jgi:integrase